MSRRKLKNQIVASLLKPFLKPKYKLSELPGEIRKILVVRQHNQFGDLLASVPLFRAIKEKYPYAELTVILSPENNYAVEKNKLIDRSFTYNKSNLFSIKYLSLFRTILRDNYDLVIVPVTVSISKTSCIIAGLAKGIFKIGPSSLDRNMNEYDFIFNKKIELNWTSSPDRHVADFGMDIIRPVGISTEDLRSQIDFDGEDLRKASEYISTNKIKIGCHIGAGKIPNRWNLANWENLIERISKNFDALFYFTGSSADSELIKNLTQKLKVPFTVIMNKSVPELAAAISKMDLFITNDTGVMHVAGAVDVKQISIFGPTNPENWKPIGNNKLVIKNSDNIDSVSVEQVYSMVVKLIGEKLVEKY